MKKCCSALVPFIFAFSVFAQVNPESKTWLSRDEAARSEKMAWQQYQRAAASRQTVASPNFDVFFYRCEWDVDPAIRSIKGAVTSYFTIITASGSIIFDLHAGLRVDSVMSRSRKLVFQHGTDHSLTIQLPQSLATGQKDSVTIFYQGVPPVSGGSFATSMQSGMPVMWTLSEPYGAKDWWPCKNGPDDKADSIDILLSYPQAYQSSSNGLPVSQWTANGRTTTYWKHRYPIASYLVAVAITNYVTYRETAMIGNIPMPVVMYAYPSHADYFRESTRIAARFLEIFSALFGPYPFSRESYSQTQFSLNGGIEHQTNSFIGNNENQLAVHELGHQWFGDRVTCGSWQDIWLNEGFATYMQFLYVENIEPFRKRDHLNDNRNTVTRESGGSVKVNDTSNANRIFDFRLTYAKGAAIVHMIRWKLGDSLFFKAMRQYLNDPLISYGTARTTDLERNLEQVSGQDFTRFFKNWYEGEGYPSYQVTWSQNNNNWVSIKLGQSTSHPSVLFFDMPVPLQLKGPGRDTTVVLDHTRNGQEFQVSAGFAVDSVIFDPELWLLSANNAITRTTAQDGFSNQIKVYANPVAGQIVVSLVNPAGKKLGIQLINAAGQLLYKQEVGLSGMNERITIPATHLPTGVYWVRVQGDGFNVVRTVRK